MIRKFLLFATLLMMTLNIFSVSVFASPCPMMNGKTEAAMAMMDMSEMPCHDNLADCMNDKGCVLMSTSPLFVLNAYLYPDVKYPKQDIAMGLESEVSHHISPPKRPPRFTS